MTLKEHEFYRITFHNVDPWLSPQKRTLATLRDLLESKSLSPTQRYELGSFLWCETMVGVFNRLEMIKGMTGRSIYLRQGEDKTTIKNEWIIYNYQFYVPVFQSVFEVALLLINEVLDLGNPYEECKFHVINKNRKVEASGVKSVLENLQRMTKEHRRGKNLLLHQGKGVAPLIRTGSPTSFNVSDLAKKAGVDDAAVIEYLKEFLVTRDQKEVLKKMTDECDHLELQVERLFTDMVPQYTRIRSFYLQSSIPR